ncbi:unnamed protein product [Coregonus sp. 'balchen']|nr:unnamed protein product [Coregonus sp. 'balchen']
MTASRPNHPALLTNAFNASFSTLHLVNKPPWVVFRRTSNISQMVVRSDLPPVPRSTFLDNVPDGNYRCSRCTQCNFTNKCTMFNHPITGKAIKIKGIILIHYCSVEKIHSRNSLAAGYSVPGS